MSTTVKLLKIKDTFEGKQTDEALLWQELYKDYENMNGIFLTKVDNKEAIISKLMESTSSALVEDNYTLTDNIYINNIMKNLHLKKILGFLIILFRSNTIRNATYYSKQLDALFFELGKDISYSDNTPIVKYLDVLEHFREDSQLNLIRQTISRINLSIITK